LTTTGSPSDTGVECLPAGFNFNIRASVVTLWFACQIVSHGLGRLSMIGSRSSSAAAIGTRRRRCGGGAAPLAES
jgi:hypothetical protein